MSLVPGTSNRGWSFYVLCQEAKPKNLQARKNNSPTIFNISNTIGRHTHTHIHTQSPNYLKLHVTLLLTIIGGTWCVSTNHLILMRGCGKGTRCLPHLFPLPPGHSARLHFPAPFAVRCAGEPEFYQWNAECSSPNSLAHINSPTKPSSRPFPPTPTAEAGNLGMSVEYRRVTKQEEPGSLSHHLKACYLPIRSTF